MSKQHKILEWKQTILISAKTERGLSEPIPSGKEKKWVFVTCC
jgi:hypothetical protein